MADSRTLWGGRYTKGTEEHARSFHSSIGFDRRLYREDIAGSIAHAAMLAERGVITPGDSEAIISGLSGILADIEAGRVQFDPADEDIHMNVERILTERIGEAGKRLHTGRSRNDQVATDMRMHMRRACDDTVDNIKTLVLTLCDIAAANTDTYMCAYTHLQQAQPTTLAHHLMAYAQMFRRDIDRFRDARRRMNMCPLGAGAVCTTTYPIDREVTAETLGFDAPCDNSIDAVSDRDFVAEYIFCASLCMMHLSRFCEELVIWSSQEFGYVRMDDGYSTGSSIMPQKKNPDMAELIRGKTGRVYGDLVTILTVLKAQPLAYNKDMQEDKECAFDAIDTLNACLAVFNGMIATARFDIVRLHDSLIGGFINATDLADYLVKKGMSFRDAHAVAARAVEEAEQRGVRLLDLSLDELAGIDPMFGPNVYTEISPEACVNKRAVTGGPAPLTVLQSVEDMRDYIDAL